MKARECYSQSAAWSLPCKTRLAGDSLASVQTKPYICVCECVYVLVAVKAWENKWCELLISSYQGSRYFWSRNDAVAYQFGCLFFSLIINHGLIPDLELASG